MCGFVLKLLPQSWKHPIVQDYIQIVHLLYCMHQGLTLLMPLRLNKQTITATLQNLMEYFPIEWRLELKWDVQQVNKSVVSASKYFLVIENTQAQHKLYISGIHCIFSNLFCHKSLAIFKMVPLQNRRPMKFGQRWSTPAMKIKWLWASLQQKQVICTMKRTISYFVW